MRETEVEKLNAESEIGGGIGRIGLGTIGKERVKVVSTISCPL